MLNGVAVGRDFTIKVSALAVISRNSAFQYKGKHIDLPRVARELKVSHVLEGSVRKAGVGVRITAQLIDGATNDHVWAERYDRDLNDIFALQDEISEAIVTALKLKLLPEEKKAIEQRGTNNPDAYNLYLMARQYYVTGNFGDVRRHKAIIRLCRRATEIDQNYARAWALMAVVQANLRYHLGRKGDGGLAATERALALDENLAEAHVAKARVLMFDADHDAALGEIEIGLRLDPESYEVNMAAGQLSLRQHRLEDAIGYLEKAAALMETDYTSAGLLVTCYTAIGDAEGARPAAQRTIARTEKIVAQEPDNGSAMGFAVVALAALGEATRAKEWTERAILLDPDNLNMRLLFGHAFAQSGEMEVALDLLGPLFEKAAFGLVNLVKIDVGLDPIRDHSRFKAMLAAAEARLAAANKIGSSPAS